MDFGLTGKTALVCAASQGIGKAAATALAEEGVNVILCARSQQALEKTSQEIQKISKAKVYAITCDLTDESSRKSLIDQVQAITDSLDILVHNVGGPKTGLAQEISLEEWQAGFERLFISVVELNQAFLPKMKTKKWGRIVAVTSLAALEPVAGLPVSNAIRSGLTAYFKTLSDEVAQDGITLNCVAPGYIQTDRIEDLFEQRRTQKGITREQYVEEFLKNIPAGRVGKPEELGALIAFLCSQQAAYITGSTICVDGGKRRSSV